MLTIERTTRFKKDFKREMKGQHKDAIQSILVQLIIKLASNEPLDGKHYDHALSNNWKDCRDCHVKPDLVLIYRKHEASLQLIRLGSHSELGL